MAYNVIIVRILTTATVATGRIKLVSVVKVDTKNSNTKKEER